MRSGALIILITILIIIVTVSCLGGVFGISTTGAPISLNSNGELQGDRTTLDSEEAPSAWDGVSFFWNAIVFAIDMSAFSIEGLPTIFYIIWWVMGLIVILCLLALFVGR